MTITIKRELDIEDLFDALTDDLSECYVCEDAKLTSNDFTPDVLADIFSELADVAAKRAARAKRE